MKGLSLLIQFMTRIPVPGKPEHNAEEMGKSYKLFPLVGMILGMILFIVYSVLSKYIENPYALALLVVLASGVITGGLHLDGLADTFDGIFSYRTKHRMLEIMRDPNLGTNGALILIAVILMKIFLLVEVGFGILLVMPVIGRLNAVLNATVSPYARPTGMAKTLVAHTNKPELAIATAITFLSVFGTINMIGGTILGWAILVPVVMGLGYYFSTVMERKIGGVTGDTLGAVTELSEVAVLFVACILF